MPHVIPRCAPTRAHPATCLAHVIAASVPEVAGGHRKEEGEDFVVVLETVQLPQSVLQEDGMPKATGNNVLGTCAIAPEKNGL